jgi:integrase
MTVSTLILRFWQHAKVYYKGSAELDNFRHALRPLRRLYGATLARDFGPLALKAVRADMLKPRKVVDPKTKKERTLPGWCRNVANRQVARIKHLFKWATENELVPGSVYHALAAVSGLRRGRSEARETDPVRPAPQADIDAALKHLSPPLQAMVKLQLLTGARGGELRRMRSCDVDTSGKVWVYRPPEHKTAHHGHTREIRLGPKAIEILAPFLKPDVQEPVFSPIDAEAWRREQLALKRKTPVQPSLVARAERAKANAHRRRRPPKARYTRESYRRAIARACKKAGVPAWHPHQLRHNAATSLRRQYGLEVARAVLGQKSGAVTEIYAEVDAATVERIMSEVG